MPFSNPLRKSLSPKLFPMMMMESDAAKPHNDNLLRVDQRLLGPRAGTPARFHYHGNRNPLTRKEGGVSPSRKNNDHHG
ncbi:hypothetical protein EYF80_000224 [Liparis tanakae]|uniref:Uncharacterized protein n=1 Tax=Liparis tanakae TaxID=230148 RepID=A0A4Z2JI67_9TELE|nr:hypothetical protein EYF80_000224 [Liparis tanakae]